MRFMLQTNTVLCAAVKVSTALESIKKKTPNLSDRRFKF
ncbi:hypothetical protein Z949_471 [Sulfitobacter guttiformis KCTC 32187]|uniref:Uncharacterized protein n=1 Tax=Sulfitobacter guttiformis TaxID=74349 RepID=A0A420DTZ6_9RHOB|nr:hypothetical protein Z949_471 [Sulfitobacter guttiformis KCTC 32187]RKE97766.1 hypothetical protein C8N30_2393 [Sulfitobacter guttiformis]